MEDIFLILASDSWDGLLWKAIRGLGDEPARASVKKKELVAGWESPS